MNINLTAHDILGHLSKSKWCKTKINNNTTYELVKYEWINFESICKVFHGREPRELRYSVEELIKNGHVEKNPNEEWKEIRAIETGEIAFEKGVYVRADNKEKADSWDNLKIRYWWVPVIGAFIVGYILGPLTTDYIKHLTQPKAEVQSSKTIDKDSQNDKDSTTTEKK